MEFLQVLAKLMVFYWYWYHDEICETSQWNQHLYLSWSFWGHQDAIRHSWWYHKQPHQWQSISFLVWSIVFSSNSFSYPILVYSNLLATSRIHSNQIHLSFIIIFRLFNQYWRCPLVYSAFFRVVIIHGVRFKVHRLLHLYLRSIKK